MGSCSWGFEDNITNLWGFPDSSAGKESSCNTGDPGLIPGSGRFPGEGHGNPLQGSCLENPHGQRCLAGYSPRRHKESDTIEWPSTVHQFMSNISIYFTFACMCMHVSDSAILWTITYQVSLSMQFSGQEYWNGLPISPPGNLPTSEIIFASPVLLVDSLPLSHLVSK